jgi:sterol 3beta-glucosyltransferase
VTIFTVGTQGDVRPFVALGRGLVGAGHKVRIATSHNFQGLVTGGGLEFAPLTADFRDIMTSEPDTMNRGLNPLVVARTARRRLKQAAASWVEEGRAAIRDTQLLVGSGIVTRLAVALAEAFDKPCVQAQLLPMTPAPDLPPMMLTPPRRPWPGPVNLILYHALRMVTWQVMKPAFNDVVRRQLGLAPYPWYGPYFEPKQGSGRNIYGYSRHVVPKPASWSANDVVTGYWFYDEASQCAATADLMRFLRAGPKPIYVGFGSMVSHDADTITRTVLQAVEMSGQRAILARGWGGITDIPSGLDGKVLVIDQAPHDWLFPRVALAVHHGGAGTTAAAVRAGIPSVVVPFFGDQPFWAWRLGQLRVAPPALPRRRLTAETLAAAINAASEDAMGQRAQKLGEQVRAEDGVTTAIETLAGWGLLPVTGALDTSPRDEVGASEFTGLWAGLPEQAGLGR